MLFEAIGARVTAVPVDDEGLVVNALPTQTRLVYVSPSHQFPLGMSMSLPRRRALIAWAADHDAAVVEDDYDSDFRYGAKPIEALQTLDKSGRVIYVGSFSKTMLPTLRLGFVIVPESLRIAAQSAKFLTDWHTSLPLQAALATLSTMDCLLATCGECEPRTKDDTRRSSRFSRGTSRTSWQSSRRRWAFM